ncbi:MAG: hypothetical protein ACK5H2_02265 [Beutenbergiaceae bacterium]
MSKKVLSFIALVITVFYALGFALWQVGDTYMIVGAVAVLLAWIGVAIVGRAQQQPPSQ